MNTVRKAILGAAVFGTALTGGAIGASFLGTANAQSDSTTTTAPDTSQLTTPPATPRDGEHGPRDESKGGHTANGITEELLTGDAADKATAAAQQAVPGGTIQRVETDAEGDAYEAHMTDASGARVTVKMDANFTVTNIETGR
jgi:hypothetical protein